MGYKRTRSEREDKNVERWFSEVHPCSSFLVLCLTGRVVGAIYVTGSTTGSWPAIGLRPWDSCLWPIGKGPAFPARRSSPTENAGAISRQVLTSYLVAAELLHGAAIEGGVPVEPPTEP